MRAQGNEGRLGRRFAIVIGVAAAGVMALGAQTTVATPDVVKYDTKLGGHKEGVFFHGPVNSEDRKCKDGRRVVVFKQRPGADRKVNETRSEDGWWEIGGPNHHYHGRLYARVTRELHTGNGFVCLADRYPNHGYILF